MSFTCAQVDHEINISIVMSKSKKFDSRRYDRLKIICQKNLIVLKSARVIWHKTWSFWSLNESFDNTNATKRKANQIKNKSNEQCESDQKSKRMRNDKKQIIDHEITIDKLYWVKKIVFDDLKFLNDHHRAFIVYRWREKSL